MASLIHCVQGAIIKKSDLCFESTPRFNELESVCVVEKPFYLLFNNKNPFKFLYSDNFYLFYVNIFSCKTFLKDILSVNVVI